jgi:mono/diheme cytochrome c family protein
MNFRADPFRPLNTTPNVAMKTTLLITLTVAIAIAAPAQAAAPAAVLTNYTKHCASCHGKDGKGLTTMGKKLEVKDLTDKKVVAEIKDDVALKNLKEASRTRAARKSRNRSPAS